MLRSFWLAAALAAPLAGGVLAQTTPGTPPVTTPAPSAPAAPTPAPAVNAAPLEAGANSFTEAQARSRLEAAGFSDVTDLRKDDQGIWRARATRAGAAVSVGLDYRGNIAAQ